MFEGIELGALVIGLPRLLIALRVGVLLRDILADVQLSATVRRLRRNGASKKEIRKFLCAHALARAGERTP